MRIVSLGAGVQSTALLLMVNRGLVEADCAIFADTQGEPAAVYKHLDWLEKESSIPVYRVTAGDLRQDTLDALTGQSRKRSGTFASIPFFVKDPSGASGGGLARRQCTKEYKLEPIWKKSRQLMRDAGVKHATILMGISLDEVQRMKGSRFKAFTNEYPLVDLRMDRHDCTMWLERWEYPKPPKSACTFCPYASDNRWREVQKVPSEWAGVVEFDRAIRHNPRLRGESFLHRQMVPIDQVDFSTLEDHGQQNWLAECEGMCGV